MSLHVRVAAKELAQTIKTLQAEIEAVGRDAHVQDAKIGELAIEVSRIYILNDTVL